MTFTSLSDLYFITIGLYSYNVIFGLLIDTGIIFIPFLTVLWSTTKDALEKGYSGEKIINALTLKLSGILAAFIFVINPISPLKVNDMTEYTRSCKASDSSMIDYPTIQKEMAKSKEAAEGNKSEEILIRMTERDVRVPMLIEFVIRAGTGVSLSATKSLPCTVDLVGVSQKLLSDNIKNKRLLVETHEFMKQCHAKARNWAHLNNDQSFPWLSDNDSDARDWAGYSGYMTKDYYGNQTLGAYANTILEGYDDYYEKGKRPTCQEWWQGKGSGIKGAVVSVSSKETSLKQRLLDEVDKSSLNMMGALIVSMAGTFNKDDYILQNYYFNPVRLREITTAQTKDYGNESEGFWGAAADLFYRAIGTVGAGVTMIEKHAVASMVQVAAPIAKSVIVMVVISILPIVLVVSQMNAKFTISIAFFLFSVMMWPFLWDLAMLTQQSYIEETVGNGASILGNPNLTMMGQFITDGLFILYPVLFTSMLTAAGMMGGQALSSMTSAADGKSAAGTAGKGGGAIKSATKSGASMAKGK
ncbi:conjugal transfer protein TraG N-terminal domain-containing protein [Thalassotalea ganghwensis]